MIDFLYLNKLFLVLIEIFGIYLAFWVYFANRKAKTNQFFSLMILIALTWTILAYFSGALIENLKISLFLARLAYGICVLFFIPFYFFALDFLQEEKNKFSFLRIIIPIVSIVISLFSVFSDFMVKSMAVVDSGAIPNLNYGKFIYFGFVFFALFLIIGYFLKRYFKSLKNEKLKLQYFLTGIFIFVIANLIFNVILPIWQKTSQYYQFGNYSIIFLLVFTAYAIVKHELMGIKTLLTQVLIVIISIILLVDVFLLSGNPTMQLLKLGILLAFLYFSREMVRSAKKEKEAREDLEKINKHLQEKTQDLESLLSLNEMSSLTVEIESSVQNIMDAVPEKLGHLGIMGTILIRYNEKRKKACAYIITESDEMRQVRKYLTKPELSDYCLNASNEDLKNCNLIIKSIVNNKIEKGSNFADFVYPSMDRSTAMGIQKSLNGKAFVSIPMTARGKKKGVLIFIFTKALVEISQRDLNLTKAFTQHVTVVMDNLHFYHHLNKNIEKLTHAKNKLKEMLSMKNDFLHIVSHQLRTPLTAMRGFISMWNEGDFDNLPADKMKEIKTRIVNNTERLNNMVNDMVMAMESEGELKVEFKSVDLRNLVAENIEMLKPSFEKKDLYLKYKETVKNIPRIEADEKLLLNVFMNLIDNAEKYTDKGGLTIKVGQYGDNVKISFIDTGIGLNKDDKKILFKKFSRGEKSNYINPNGSGLGLFIIKQIIRKHHGKIKATSKGEGKGATFAITLPVRQGR